MENMDFGSGGSTLIQYIPTVEPEAPAPPSGDFSFGGRSEGPPSIDRQMGIMTRNEGPVRGEVPPAGPGAAFMNEKTSAPDNNTMMDFSTPLSDVMPSANFDGDESAPGGVNSATYTSPTTNRVTAVSPGMIGATPSKKSGNPLGLTDEQFQAAVAGVAAVIAFSKPVQDKLADVVPKFMSEAGNLSTTGMAVSALIAAVLFFFALKFLKGQ
jgi:hypothetical protein